MAQMGFMQQMGDHASVISFSTLSSKINSMKLLLVHNRKQFIFKIVTLGVKFNSLKFKIVALNRKFLL